jgi:polar amino acid transport system substrate-binding protein
MIFNFRFLMQGLVAKCVAITIAASMLLLAAAGCDNGPPNEINAPEEVKGHIIGSIEGSPSELLAEELGKSKPFASGDELMYNLKAGSLDCVIMDDSAAAELVLATSGVRVLSAPLMEYDLRFAVAKENSSLLAAVNSALVALADNGTLKGLLDKYFAGKKFTYVPTSGGEERDKSLSLAVPPDYPPYSYRDGAGKLCGLNVEVAQAVCDFLDVELIIVEYEARELVTAVWYGRADLALGWIPTEGEDKIAESEPYADSKQVVIVRR